MKKMFLMLTLLVSVSAFAGKPAQDTVPATNSLITKWIVDEVPSKDGKTSVKYYVIYNNSLVATTKTVVERAKLAQRHHVNINYFIVRKNNKVIKLIE